MFSLLDRAEGAQWFGGTQTYLGAEPTELDVGFTSVPVARNGVVAHRSQLGTKLEGEQPADNEPDYLHTHPAWEQGGMVVGIYPSYRVREGESFTAKVGFLDGADGSDGVNFLFGVIPDPNQMPEIKHFFERGRSRQLRDRFLFLRDVQKDYDGTLRDFDVDLSRFEGQNIQPVLIVQAGNSSGRDWAAWAEPRIEAQRELVISGVQCLEESTSGWNKRTRDRRRRWFSDEFALLVQVLAFDEGYFNKLESFAAVRSNSDLDSGESFSFPSIRFAVSPAEVAHLEVRMIGLELDGVGATGELAQYSLNNWAGTTFLAADGNNVSPRYSFNNSYNGRGGNKHNLLVADFWQVDIVDMLAGGVEPAGLFIASSDASTVPGYLNEVGITRDIAVNRVGDIATESRRYRSGPHYSDYLVNITYR